MITITGIAQGNAQDRFPLIVTNNNIIEHCRRDSNQSIEIDPFHHDSAERLKEMERAEMVTETLIHHRYEPPERRSHRK